ncbi:MAG TPA: insulinase family protein, partial [Treponemataceae bacterium]|nr:insulinase family protein [Treponemataceae bacterium]
NKHRSCVTVVPDKTYTEKLDKTEQKNISSITSGMSKAEKKGFIQKTRTNQNVLQKAMLEPESLEKRTLIPHLYSSQLKTCVGNIHTDQTKVGDVPLFIHNQATNGIVYLTVAIPVDVLDPGDYQYLTLYSTMLTNTGFAGKPWAQTESEAARVLGGLGAKTFTASMLETENAKKLKKGKNKNLLGRDWLFVNIKCLQEKTEPALEILFDCLDSADFSDTTRLKDMFITLRNSFDNAVVPGGSQFALSRTCCTTTRPKAINEIWNGLSQLMFLHNVSFKNLNNIAKRLQSIQKKLHSAGMIFNITADETGLKTAKPLLEKIAKQRKAPVASKTISDCEFYDLTAIPSQIERKKNRIKVPYTRYIVPAQVGFAASAKTASPYGSKESVGETLLAHWLSNGALYERIRTVGGAYGAGAGVDGIEKIFMFYTYRDPDPDKSIVVFEDVIKEVAKLQIDKTELERLITGSYSKLVQPKSPAVNGATGFIRILYGITDEDREKNLKSILVSTSDDIKAAAKRLMDNDKGIKSVIISNKKNRYTGKIISLPV